jgi:hypothetical protein
VKSSKKTAATCVYLGVDLTDRYADSSRDVDVCGLEIGDSGLIAHFWTWSWGSSERIEVTELLPEIEVARAVMLDGPQGLARIGCTIRTCERSLAAAGKTADTRPPLSQPYAGFAASSLDLFAAFHAAGLFDPSAPRTGIHEVYPAAIWSRLAHRLPNKRRRDGRQIRAAILQALGVALPERLLSHDELDACAAALLGAAGDGRVQGIGVVAVGEAVYWDDASACLREGQILIPEVDAVVCAKLQSVVGAWVTASPVQRQRVIRRRAPLALRSVGDSRRVPRPSLDGETREGRARQLFDVLASELLAGRPTLCTYKAAVNVVLRYEKYTPAYGSTLLKLATRTGAFAVDSLGEIKLDTFLVNQERRPGDGHWKSAAYTPAQWDRAFSTASVIE